MGKSRNNQKSKNEINKKILSVREAKKDRRITATTNLADELKELQDKCICAADNYVRENYSQWCKSQKYNGRVSL